MHTATKNRCALALAGLLLLVPLAAAGDEQAGMRSDPAAVADARAMVEAMGGLEIWREVESVHFVHEWDIANRQDRYREHDYWSITNGEFARGSAEQLANAMERAPYSIYRLARAVARDDAELEIRYGTRDGLVRYEMVSLTGSPQRPELELFAPPEEHRGDGRSQQ
jgi:hypothetical protein